MPRFPAVVAIYSAVLGIFVPSGGSKWIIEAPYVMAADETLNRSGRRQHVAGEITSTI